MKYIGKLHRTYVAPFGFKEQIFLIFEAMPKLVVLLLVPHILNSLNTIMKSNSQFTLDSYLISVQSCQKIFMKKLIFTLTIIYNHSEVGDMIPERVPIFPTDDMY